MHLAAGACPGGRTAGVNPLAICCEWGFSGTFATLP
jgi:hypothetical protein